MVNMQLISIVRIANKIKEKLFSDLELSRLDHSSTCICEVIHIKTTIEFCKI